MVGLSLPWVQDYFYDHYCINGWLGSYHDQDYKKSTFCRSLILVIPHGSERYTCHLKSKCFPSYGTVLRKIEMHGPAEMATKIATENLWKTSFEPLCFKILYRCIKSHDKHGQQ